MSELVKWEKPDFGVAEINQPARRPRHISTRPARYQPTVKSSGVFVFCILLYNVQCVSFTAFDCECVPVAVIERLKRCSFEVYFTFLLCSRGSTRVHFRPSANLFLLQLPITRSSLDG